MHDLLRKDKYNFFGVWVGVQYLIESKWTTEQQRLPLLLCGRPGVDLERMRTQSGLLCEDGADESVALGHRLELGGKQGGRAR